MKENTQEAVAQHHSYHHATATSSLYITTVHKADKNFTAHRLQLLNQEQSDLLSFLLLTEERY